MISQDTSAELHDGSLLQLTTKAKKEKVDSELKVKVENPKFLKLQAELKVVSTGVSRLEKQVTGLRKQVAILKAIPNPTFAWLGEGAELSPPEPMPKPTCAWLRGGGSEL